MFPASSPQMITAISKTKGKHLRPQKKKGDNIIVSVDKYEDRDELEITEAKKEN
jgi:hypothetical protein